jgi:hypothetical protein
MQAKALCRFVGFLLLSPDACQTPIDSPPAKSSVKRIFLHRLRLRYQIDPWGAYGDFEDDDDCAWAFDDNCFRGD